MGTLTFFLRMFLISLLFAVAYANTEYVSTPHGKRLKQCVMNFPQGTTVEELPNGKLGVEYEDGSSEVITPPEECHADMARMMKERDMAKANAPNPINLAAESMSCFAAEVDSRAWEVAGLMDL